MLRSHKRLTKEQRYSILSEHIDGGISVSELSRKYQINPVTIYSWKRAMKENDNDSLDPKELLEEIERLKSENSKLKHTVADQALDITTLKQWQDFVKKKLREEKLNSPKNSSRKKK